MRSILVLLLLAVPATAQGSAYNYCQSNPNSYGTPALIGYSGSLDLSVGTFTLNVAGCPPAPESFGMFTAGQVQYNVPFGNGYLCVQPFTPGIHRMATQSLVPGVISYNLAQSPEFALFQPGSSWNFQFWYRNPLGGGSGFNLSDALHVDFAP